MKMETAQAAMVPVIQYHMIDKPSAARACGEGLRRRRGLHGR